MNGLRVRRPDHIQGVKWVLRYQLAAVQRPALVAVDLNLAATMIARTTMPTVQAPREGVNESATLSLRS